MKVKYNFNPAVGKLICDGCVYTMQIREGKFLRCPFCRVPNATSNDEHIKWTKELMDKGDAEAFSFLAFSYESGRYGLPQDCAKAHELYLKAGELGCAEAYYNLGQVFSQGRGVEVDKTKAKHYYELAAIGGDMHARHNIGCTEGRDGNLPRAMKHFMIGARAGNDRSLDNVKTGFMRGIVTKDEYASTLRAHQLRKDEMKSDSREKAEAYYRHLS